MGDKKAGTLTITIMEALLSEERPAAVQVVLKQARQRQYFPQSYTTQQMKEVIVSLPETCWSATDGWWIIRLFCWLSTTILSAVESV